MINWVYDYKNHTSIVMISVIASSVVDREFESRLGQTKDYKIGICCFSIVHSALKGKSEDWLVRYHNNVSRCTDMSTCRLMLQRVSSADLVESGHHYYHIESM